MTMLQRCGFSARPFLHMGAALGVLALVSACAVGPDFHRPAAPDIDRYTRQPSIAKTASAEIPGGEEQRFVNGQEIAHQWWMLFQSPQLNALIEGAIKTNPTLAAAQAALKQAMEVVHAQQGFFYPTVQANFSPSRH